MSGLRVDAHDLLAAARRHRVRRQIQRCGATCVGVVVLCLRGMDVLATDWSTCAQLAIPLLVCPNNTSHCVDVVCGAQSALRTLRFATRLNSATETPGISVIRPVDHGGVDNALLHTLIRGDRLVLAGIDEVRECLLQCRGERGSLLDRPPVGGHVLHGAGRLKLVTTLLDGVVSDR